MTIYPTLRQLFVRNTSYKYIRKNLNMKIRYTVLLGIWASFLSAQIKTELFTSQAPFTSQHQLEYHQGHLYLPVAWGDLGFGIHNHKQWLYKLDLTLQKVDSLEIPLPATRDSSGNALMDMIIHQDKIYLLYWYYSVAGRNCGMAAESFLFELDTNLQILKRREYHNPGTFHFYEHLAIGSQGELILAGSFLNCAGDGGPTLWVIDEPKDTAYHRYYLDLEMKDALSLYDFGGAGDRYAMHIQTIHAHHKNLVLLDENFEVLAQNIDESDDPQYPLEFQYGDFFSGVNDSLMMVGLVKSMPLNLVIQHMGQAVNYYQLALGAVSEFARPILCDTLPLLYFGLGYDNDTMPGVSGDFFDARNLDSLALIASDRSLWGFEMYHQDSNRFFLYNYDVDDRQLNWQREFITHTATSNHMVEALPGNRYAIAFIEYDRRRFSQPYSTVQVWILDDQGQLSQQRQLKASQPWTVFPNPAQDVLNIQAPLGTPYELLNSAGQSLKTGKLTARELPVSDLPRGVYLLKLGDQSLRVQLGR